MLRVCAENMSYSDFKYIFLQYTMDANMNKIHKPFNFPKIFVTTKEDLMIQRYVKLIYCS